LLTAGGFGCSIFFRLLLTRGDLDTKVVETLLDMCDGDGNGQINYTEFAGVVMAGAN